MNFDNTHTVIYGTVDGDEENKPFRNLDKATRYAKTLQKFNKYDYIEVQDASGEVCNY